MQLPPADKKGRNVTDCGNMPRFSRIFIKKVYKEYNSTSTSHHHAKLILLSHGSIKKLRKSKTARTQHKSMAAIVPYTDDR